MVTPTLWEGTEELTAPREQVVGEDGGSQPGAACAALLCAPWEPDLGPCMGYPARKPGETGNLLQEESTSMILRLLTPVWSLKVLFCFGFVLFVCLFFLLSKYSQCSKLVEFQAGWLEKIINFTSYKSTYFTQGSFQNILPLCVAVSYSQESTGSALCPKTG